MSAQYDEAGLCLVCRHHRSWHGRSEVYECDACRGPCLDRRRG